MDVCHLTSGNSNLLNESSPPPLPRRAPNSLAGPIHGLPHIPWRWSSAQGSVSKGTDVPLPKLLDSFCVGVLLTGDVSYLCNMDSLDCLAR